MLDDYLEELQYQKLHTYHLIENFRSSQKLIEEMEKTFGRWREKELLPPDERPMYSRQDNSMDEDQVFNLYTDEFT
ncbi:hypothetical protein COE47_34590, partial [Bacillus thuringiensis]